MANGLVMDIRGVTPSMRRPLVFAVIDRMVDLDCENSMVVICDHDPSGLGYQLDLRRESRGLFEFDCDQRLGRGVGRPHPSAVALDESRQQVREIVETSR